MSGEGKVVCVTGASGYIASWLVKLLLNRGYTVHATVRSLDDPKKTEHLLAFDGAKERLLLFEANLSVEGSFDSAVSGCVCVFHTASPVILTSVYEPKVTDPQKELLDPAVKGTLNVLKSVVKVKSVKRVILTSSMAAVMFTDRLAESAGGVVDETWFSDQVFCERLKIYYHLAKTLAEDAAVKFSKENGLDLVVINPGYVIGPLLQPTLNFTSEGFMNFIEKGKEVFPDRIYILVDVKDSVVAHILALEKPEANGRYCMVGYLIRAQEIMMILDKLYPDRGYSLRYKDNCVEAIPYSISTAKAESLGVEFTPFEVSLKDTIESLKEKKFMNP
ncbi:phenylacetaldehyde reductase-like [Bidens hawaiensis]|uniref:phenylacetaldehyde reductase-like n=1 Tax=Bidens hawaiensis TaxID=980011 RepID=UPI00404AAA1D